MNVKTKLAKFDKEIKPKYISETKGFNYIYSKDNRGYNEKLEKFCKENGLTVAQLNKKEKSRKIIRVQSIERYEYLYGEGFCIFSGRWK